MIQSLRAHNWALKLQPQRWFGFYASAALFACVLSVLLVATSPAPRTHHPDMSVPILMYHHVGDWGAANPAWAPYVVKPQEFARQLDWLAAHQFHTITFQELLAYQSNNVRPPAHSVILTFDDGWAEDVDIAKKFLAPRGMRGVFFVYTGAVAEQDNGSGYVSWNQVRQLEEAGEEVQSHTVSHASLDTLAPSRLEFEMINSRDTMQAHVGHAVEVLAYPFGHHDERVIRATRDAGYKLGIAADDEIVAVEPHEQWGNFQVRRFKVAYGDGIDVFAARMAEHAQK